MKRFKINLKRYISFLAVLIILVSIASPSSYALDWNATSRQRFGSMIASALLAGQMMISSVLAPVQQMYDYIPDALGLSTATWDDDYLDRSKVQIWPDYIEIDDVPYTDIWFSHDAAEKFRIDAYDFKTAYNLVSNSNGTFASGTGHVDGLPIYNVNNELISQSYMYPPVVGTYEFSDNVDVKVVESGGYKSVLGNVNGSDYRINTGLTNNQFPVKVRYKVENNTGKTQFQRADLPNYWGTSSYMPNMTYTSAAFDFDWVTGTIPADEVLPADTGMMIRIPSDSPGLQTFITNNIDFTIDGGIELDFQTDPTLQVKIDDLIDIIAPIVPYLDFGDIQFIVNHEEPIPPVPDVPIIDATVPQVVQPIINEITNYGDQITQQIPNIIETIPNIDDICNNIDTAPYHDLDNGLDHLPTVFLPFITDLRSALGIWHYVTEWLSQISSTFAFITGCLVGTSILTPIYAAIAGFMCIKIYRRMTA